MKRALLAAAETLGIPTSGWWQCSGCIIEFRESELELRPGLAAGWKWGRCPKCRKERAFRPWDELTRRRILPAVDGPR